MKDAGEAFQQGGEIPPEPTLSKLPIYNLTEFVARYGHKPVFIVQDWLVKAATAMMVGLPGAGKSPLVQKLIAHICLGIPFFGLAVTQMRVVLGIGKSHGQAALNVIRFAAMIIAEQTGSNFEADPDLFMQRAHEEMLDWFAVVPASFTVEHDMNAFIETVETFSIQRWGGEPPGLVVPGHTAIIVSWLTDEG